MTRTFIAIELDGALQDYLGGVMRRLALQLPRLSWLKPAGIHLTLAFLGELDDARLGLARQAASEAAAQVDPFRYRLSRLGTFGPSRQPRVLWIGIDEPSGRLAHLHAALNRQLEGAGFPLERRPFAPHLTLARIKASLDAVEYQQLQHLLTTQPFTSHSPQQEVRHLSVMKSELSRSGATYTCLKACPLGDQRP